MTTAWRIVRNKHAATAFSGEGAARAGGRWNSKGIPMVYSSGSRALAALETLVHINPQITLSYLIFQIEFEETWVRKFPVGKLPEDWKTEPPGFATQRLGDEWIRNGESAVIALPSVLIPNEVNYMLNPAHRDFKKIRIGPAQPFAFDSRLVG